MRADALGNFNGAITLPSDLAPGSYTLNVDGTKADGTPFFTSLALAAGESTGAGATPTTGSSDGTVTAASGSTNGTVGELAITGVSSTTSFMSGLLLVGFGAGLVLFATQAQRVRKGGATD